MVFEQLDDATGTMSRWAGTEMGLERARLDFADAVRKRFAFLRDRGFTETEASPTIVRYRKDDLEIDVSHGRQSFEVGFGIALQGTRYSLSELIRAADPVAAEQYRNEAATTPSRVAEALARLQELVERYGDRALQGDGMYFSGLERQRESWAQAYALDVLEGQVRPKAEAAFRDGDYRHAAELYEKIRARLSEVELRKLALARERAGL